MREKFSNLGIRTKLLISVILLVTVPVLVIARGSFLVSSRIVEQKTNQYSHDILYQTAKTMESRLDKIEDISFNISFHNDVQNILLEEMGGRRDPFEESQVRLRMESVLSSHVLYHDEINAIYVVSFGKAGSVYELDKTKQKYGLMEDHLEKIRAGAGGNVWFGGLPDKRVTVLTRIINSVRTQKPIGYLVMYVEENYLFELLSDTYSVQNGEINLINKDGIIISDSDKERIGTVSTVYKGKAESEEYGFTSQRIGGIDHYVALSEPMKNGWRIMTVVPVSVYQSEIIGLRNSIVLFALLLLLLSVLCAWGLSVSISKPIRKLSMIMSRFGEGNFSVRCPVGAQNEIGKLSGTFNQMADNINELVQKVYDEQLMKQEAELKSLQMQINPHFLYNTLETINWMARSRGNEEIGIMAKSLGDLMRSTINGKDYVLLEDEAASLQNYLQIQKYRYGNKLEAFIGLGSGTEKLYVPKLIIQPLVENAIYHGIEPAFDCGTLHVTSLINGGKLEIKVSDTGVGMTQETIEDILHISGQERRTEPHSIGLQNVIKRIKTLFGNDYGVTIESELGEGTVITVSLPVLTDMP
ncbi:MAG: sensor histidine kinase [Lacrimispora sp.]